MIVRTGQEIEDFTQKEAIKIIESLKGESYEVVEKILQKARIRLEKKAIVV